MLFYSNADVFNGRAYLINVSVSLLPVLLKLPIGFNVVVRRFLVGSFKFF